MSENTAPPSADGSIEGSCVIVEVGEGPAPLPFPLRLRVAKLDVLSPSGSAKRLAKLRASGAVEETLGQQERRMERASAFQRLMAGEEEPKEEDTIWEILARLW